MPDTSPLPLVLGFRFEKNIQVLPIPKKWTPHYSRDCSLIGMGGCVRIRKRNMFRTLICKAMQTCICISFYLYSGVITVVSCMYVHMQM